MPNHVINEIIFRNVDRNRQDELLRACCNDEGKVDFEKLVPTPKNVWLFSVGSRHEKAFKINGLDWSRQNWGTKWNAYDHKPTERTDDTLILRFETAWTPPYGWLCAIFNTFRCRFEHNWFSEGGEAASGIFEWPPNDSDMMHDPWREEVVTPEMQKHLHKLLYGVEEFDDEAA